MRQDSFFFIWKNQDTCDLNYENDTLGAQQQKCFNPPTSIDIMFILLLWI